MRSPSRKLLWGGLVAVLVLFAAGACLILAINPTPEPLYQGKPISFWIISGREANPDDEGIQVITNIGPPAIPVLVGLLNRHFSKSEETYRKVSPKIPAFISKFLRPPAAPYDTQDLTRFAYVFGQFGPAAEPAVPVLSQFLLQSNLNVRMWGCIALTEIGPTASNTIPLIMEVVRSGIRESNATVIWMATRALGPLAAWIVRRFPP